ncbi:hypothetical protein BGLA2_700138 [Burkholderia gladioli]|nr:hypothetical protein BGLA2_700138 [Burkholderia gladioli]
MRADCFSAAVEPYRNLSHRHSLLEQSHHIQLARRQYACLHICARTVARVTKNFSGDIRIHICFPAHDPLDNSRQIKGFFAGFHHECRYPFPHRPVDEQSILSFGQKNNFHARIVSSNPFDHPHPIRNRVAVERIIADQHITLTVRQ